MIPVLSLIIKFKSDALKKLCRMPYVLAQRSGEINVRK